VDMKLQCKHNNRNQLYDLGNKYKELLEKLFVFTKSRSSIWWWWFCIDTCPFKISFIIMEKVAPSLFECTVNW